MYDMKLFSYAPSIRYLAAFLAEPSGHGNKSSHLDRFGGSKYPVVRHTSHTNRFSSVPST